MATRRPPVEMPKVTNRSSSNEWSGSTPVADRTSHDVAVEDVEYVRPGDTPLLARLFEPRPGQRGGITRVRYRFVRNGVCLVSTS